MKVRAFDAGEARLKAGSFQWCYGMKLSHELTMAA
jgi:hypothetical protein